MKVKTLNLINVALVSTLIFGVALAWNISRFRVQSFSSTQEYVVYPSRSVVKAKPASPNVSPAPLPLVSPRIVFQIMPVYPSSALSEGIEGTVLLGAIGFLAINLLVDIGYSVLDPRIQTD